MPIKFHSETQEFHLYNDSISYIMKLMPNNQLGQLYFGARVADDDYSYLMENIYRPFSAYVFDNEYSLSLEHQRQELPSYGTTDFRMPAVEIKQENGSTITNFVYKSHNIFSGKKKLAGLPASYVESDDEAATLEITLADELTGIEAILSYTIYENRSVIARSVKYVNNGTQAAHLTTAMSLSLDLPDADYDFMQFSGAWARERNLKVRHLEPGIQSVGSLRGCSSPHQNPFIILKRPHTTEFTGEAIGFTLVYSGNFLAQAEVDTYDVTRVMLGINPHCFDWKLAPKGEFQTPEALITYTNSGLNTLSQTLHSLLRERVARGYWRDKDRPILLNNWEATYFDFDEEKLVKIATKAKEAGVELFVLDDGWFGKRTGETAGLGDWWANTDRLPNGIKGLSERIEKLGLKFGLWVELEMVNKDTELYRNHPDYMLATPNRHASHGRRQYVLDFSRPEVVDYIHDLIYKVLSDSKVSYIKWDMNRSITECYSIAFPADQQGEIFHRYILGVYDLYERLTSEFPHILFESCSSGGGRFDAGMLYYAPQAWTSDDTDAVERLSIQYGTSYCYPVSMMGAHVSITPNHQLNRLTPLKLRGDVAYFGAFGYELDLARLSLEEQEQVKDQIRFAKKYRHLIQYGTYYRLASPFEGNLTAWMVTSKDKKQAIVFYCRKLNDVNCPYRRLYLKGLLADTKYNLAEESGEDLGSFGGDALMNIGMVTSDNASGQPYEGNLPTDFYGKLVVLQAQE